MSQADTASPSPVSPDDVVALADRWGLDSLATRLTEAVFTDR